MSRALGEVHVAALQEWIRSMRAKFPCDGDGRIVREADGGIDLAPIDDWLYDGRLNRTRLARALRLSDRKTLDHNSGMNELLKAFEDELGIAGSDRPGAGTSMASRAAREQIDRLKELNGRYLQQLALTRRELKAAQATILEQARQLETQYPHIHRVEVATGRNVPAPARPDTGQDPQAEWLASSEDCGGREV